MTQPPTATAEPGPGDGSTYLEHIAHDSARFLAAVLAAPSDAPVPSCPDWSADDLLWHLGEVQWFWSELVRTRPAGPDAYTEPERPSDRDGLAAFYRTASAALQGRLPGTPPDAMVWTWSPQDHTARFIRRRQAHEALIHRVDAELAAGERTPLDPVLAADGVDEALRIMYGGVPPWGTFTPDGEGAAVRLTATDVGRSWLTALGVWSGTSPNTGKSYADAPVFEIVPDDGRPVASISGAAGDLDCLLWNRAPLGEVARAGDGRSLALFDAVIAEGIQ
jgi:uncharacterized protein (TIGR03083 family)